MSDAYRILIVDDERNVRATLKGVIEDEGYVELFLKPDQPLRRARLIFTQMRRAEANAARAQAEAAE